MPPKKSTKSPEERVTGFNRAYPIGTKALYTSSPGAEPRATKIVSAGWVLGGHTPVVMVEGVSGCVAFDALVLFPNE